MPLKTHHNEQPTLNMTPMIDIVFLLIIFFMVGTKFTELERKIGLKVPQISETGTLTSAPERKVINVHRDGQVTLDRNVVSLDQLSQRLSTSLSEYPDLGVLIRGDAGSPFQNVAEVLGACRRAGIAEMGISVRIARRE